MGRIPYSEGMAWVWGGRSRTAPAGGQGACPVQYLAQLRPCGHRAQLRGVPPWTDHRTHGLINVVVFSPHAGEQADSAMTRSRQGEK